MVVALINRIIDSYKDLFILLGNLNRKLSSEERELIAVFSVTFLMVLYINWNTPNIWSLIGDIFFGACSHCLWIFAIFAREVSKKTIVKIHSSP